MNRICPALLMALSLLFPQLLRAQAHGFITQADFIAGASRVGQKDVALTGFATAVKGAYQFNGMLAVHMGGGFNYLYSERKKDDGSGGYRYATMLTLPIGINCTFGDDRGLILTGVDVIPACYTSLKGSPGSSPRSLVIGIGAEFGCALRLAGRFQIGTLGKLQFFPSADNNDQVFPLMSFAGAGVVVRID